MRRVVYCALCAVVALAAVFGLESNVKAQCATTYSNDHPAGYEVESGVVWCCTTAGTKRVGPCAPGIDGSNCSTTVKRYIQAWGANCDGSAETGYKCELGDVDTLTFTFRKCGSAKSPGCVYGAGVAGQEQKVIVKPCP